jgi:hypothetical protein
MTQLGQNIVAEMTVAQIIETNDKWRYTLNRTPQRYNVGGCATIVHNDIYDISIDVPATDEWLDWLYGAAQYCQYWSPVDVKRYNGRATLRVYVSSPQCIAALIRLATCSCGSCEYVQRRNGTLPPPPPLSGCSDRPVLHGRGWQITYCYGIYRIDADSDISLAEALIGAVVSDFTPAVFVGDRYYLVLRRDELTIRITAPVQPRTAGYLYAAVTDIAWNWKLTPNVTLYDDGMEVVTWVVTHILGVPNIHSLSRLLYAAGKA